MTTSIFHFSVHFSSSVVKKEHNAWTLKKYISDDLMYACVYGEQNDFKWNCNLIYDVYKCIKNMKFITMDLIKSNQNFISK